ncbi:MAG TPA: glycosyltransferase family 39 protein, partial [bacterium]|nr:glycosyltransferase family 39 protein [bacterium]
MSSEGRASGKHLLVLLLLCLSVWGWTYGLWDLWGADETRYTQVSRELLTRNNWLVLTVFDRPYDQKPPLSFWIYALMLKLAGGRISVWHLRLAPILFAMATLGMTYFLGRRVCGEKVGFLASLMVFTSTVFISEATEVKMDIMFTAWITLSLTLWLCRTKGEPLGLLRAFGVWAALAAAFFTKGPLAILIVISSIATEAWSEHTWKVFRDARTVWGLLGLGLLIAGWLHAQASAAGSEFVATQVRGETLNRLLHGAHDEPVWFYFNSLYQKIFTPWVLLWIPLFLRLRSGQMRFPKQLLPFAGWFAIPFLILIIARGKRPPYMLPLLPAMAIVTAWLLDRLIEERRFAPKLNRALCILFPILGVALLIAVIILQRFTQLHV